MSFDSGSRLDPSQVSDGRGVGGGVGGGGGGFGRGGLIAGGGIGGLVIALIAVMLGLNPGDLEGQHTASGSETSAATTSVQGCTTGEAANARSDCRVVATVNSLNQFWSAYLPRYDVDFTRPEVRLFSDRVSTGCGAASSATGPFYCPTDATAYFDLGFFSLLRQQFDTAGGPLGAQRQRWFMTGYRSGDITRCDTLRASSL